MPGNSSASGNMSPQSTAMRSSPDSTSIMLRPISPSPPRGISRTVGSLRAPRELLSVERLHGSTRASGAETSEGGLGLQARDEGVGVTFELRALGARAGVAGDELLTERVDASAGLDHLVVEMRPGAQPGRAHVADHLPLVHARPAPDVAADPGEMRVAGLVAGAVANQHREAVAAIPSGVRHGAVGDRTVRRARWRGEFLGEVGQL